MATSGIVKSVSGTVTATAADGTERILQVGDMVLPNEQIVTGAAGTISVDFEDGTHMDMGRGSRLTLNDEELGIDPEANGEEDMAEALDDVAAMQAALENGGDFDPNNMEATAAGAGTTGNEGSTTVNVAFVGGEVTPDSGFDSIGIDRGVVADSTRPPLTTVVDLTVSGANGAVGFSATSIDEDVAEVTFSVSLSTPGESNVTIATTLGDIIIPAGQTTGSLVVPLDNSDVYIDPDVLTGSIISVTGGGFDVIEYVNKTAEVTITDTIDTTVVSLSSPDINEDATNATVTVNLSNPGETAVTVTTNLGSVVIPAGETSGTIDVPLDNSDVYVDPETLTVEVTAVEGGNFEAVDFSEAVATVVVDDTTDITQVTLSSPDINEDATNATITVSLSNPGETAVTVTTNLGSVVIPAGETSGTIDVPLDNSDVYTDPDTLAVEVTAVDGGNFEAVDFSKAAATVAIDDTIDTVQVVLTATPTVAEGAGADTITYTATIYTVDASGNPTTTTAIANNAVTVTLNNGETITIPAGSATSNVTVDAETDDVYLEATDLSVSITGAVEDVAGTGDKFEDLTVSAAPADTDVTDTIDTVQVVLTATPTVAEGAGADTITYTATIYTVDASGNPTTTTAIANNAVTVTLNNGETITIPAGSATSNVTVDAETDDVYLEATDLSVSITGAVEDVAGTGDKFEDLTVSAAPADTDVTDTIDTVTATLTADVSEIAEDGGDITYTVTLTGTPGYIDPDTNLTFKLSNGEEVTIIAGQTSGSITKTYTDAEITNQVSISNSFASPAVILGGIEYEYLQTAGTTLVDVDYGVSITDLTAKAQGGDLIIDEDDLLASRGIGESAGSDQSQSVIQQGTFTIAAGDGVDLLTVDGNAVITGGVFATTSFTTALGNTLAITGFDGAMITYTYTLNDNELSTLSVDDGQDSIFEDFAVVLKDTDTPIADEATGTLAIQIVDDVPTAKLALVGSGDKEIAETSSGPVFLNFDLTTAGSVEGADGAVSAYSLALDALTGTTVLPDSGIYSGLTTISGSNIYLYTTANNIVVGRADNISGVVIFTIAIDTGTGEAEVVLSTGGLFHEKPTEDDVVRMTGLKLDAVHTMTDADGDVSTASVSLSDAISFTDGVPQVTGSTNVITTNTLNTVTGSVDVDFAADGFGEYTSITGPVIEGVVYDSLVKNPDGSATLTAKDSEGNELFEVTMNADGTYDFIVLDTNPVTTSSSTLKGLGASGPDGYLQVSGDFSTIIFEGTNIGDEVNSSGQGMGINDNLLKAGDTLSMTFFDETYDSPLHDIDLTNDTDPYDPSAANLDAFRSDTTDVSLHVQKMSGGETVTLTVNYISSGGVITLYSIYIEGKSIGNNRVDDELSWTLKDSSGNSIAIGTYTLVSELSLDGTEFSSTELGESSDIWFSLSDIGLPSGTLFNDIDISSTSGDVRLLEMSSEQSLFPADQTFDFNYDVADADGDVVSGSFSATIVGEEATGFILDGTSEGEVIQGSAYADILSGLGGNDLLIGGAGDDSLTGGTGSDTFLAHDVLPSPLESGDTITDFNQSGGSYNGTEGDTLDLSDLLTGSTIDQNNIDTYLNITDDGYGNTTVAVDTTGSSSFTTVAILEGVTANDISIDLTTLIVEDTDGV